MPFNLLKCYNECLELESLTENQRSESLRKIFNRDFIMYQNKFKHKNIIPTPKDGEDTMGTLFNHLTRCKDSVSANGERLFDIHRSKRIHWIRYHFENRVDSVCIFSVQEKDGIRTYIFNKDESYVIVLEPKKDNYYFLITAYHLKGGDKRKINQKKKRALADTY